MEELEAFSIDDLIAEVKAKILDRSSGGIKGIARIFKAMDDNGNHQLDVEDFRWGFIDYGFNLTQEEAQHLVNYFDRDGNGSVSYDEFLRCLKVSTLHLRTSPQPIECRPR
jgi:calcyphosin